MNTEFIGLLVKCVESYPCVWDTSNSSYSKRECTEQAWEDIAKICGHSEKYCREKWKNVRTGFLRSVAKGRRFYLFETMKFLLPIRTVRPMDSLASQSQSSLQEQPNMNHNLKNNSVSDEYNSLCDNVVQIEDSSASVASLEASFCDELYNLENAKVETASTTTPTTGYFSQFCSVSESQSQATQNDSENKNSLISCYSSRKRKHRRHTSPNSDDDDEFNKKTKEEKALMSFFKGISADILSLSIQKQRVFKRKMVELVDDLHGEEDQMKEKKEISKREHLPSLIEN